MTRNLLRSERIVFKTPVHLMAVVNNVFWTFNAKQDFFRSVRT